MTGAKARIMGLSPSPSSSSARSIMADMCHLFSRSRVSHFRGAVHLVTWFLPRVGSRDEEGRQPPRGQRASILANYHKGKKRGMGIMSTHLSWGLRRCRLLLPRLLVVPRRTKDCQLFFRLDHLRNRLVTHPLALLVQQLRTIFQTMVPAQQLDSIGFSLSR